SIFLRFEDGLGKFRSYVGCEPIQLQRSESRGDRTGGGAGAAGDAGDSQAIRRLERGQRIEGGGATGREPDVRGGGVRGGGGAERVGEEHVVEHRGGNDGSRRGGGVAGREADGWAGAGS